MQVNRCLYRCRHDKRVAGVASGVAEYFEVDPSIVRVIWFLSIFLGGMGLLLYIAMALIVPLEPELGFAPGGAPVGDPTGETATGTAGDVPAGPAAARIPGEATFVSPGIAFAPGTGPAGGAGPLGLARRASNPIRAFLLS